MDRVLLVDDDLEVLQVNGRFLEGKGFLVSTASNAKDAIKLVKSFKPDCVVMDVMMPGMDGFEALKQLLQFTGAPVLFLTGRVEEPDRIRGLSEGAEDYITKPCSLEELALRIQIHISRSRPEQKEAGVLEFAPLRIELMNRKVTCHGEEVPLSNREFELLVCLAKHAGKIMTFEEIGREVLGGYLDTDRRNIMMNASRLRKKLESYVGLENMIETEWGKGYRFRG